MLEVSTYPLGPVQTNCYIVKNKEGFCLLIDPGEEGGRIITVIENAGLIPTAILLTHAHFDHIGAVDVIREKFSIPVYIHKEEEDWLSDPSLNGSIKYPGLPLVQNKNPDFLITTEGKMEVSPFEFEVRHTPGHSPGSISYIFNDSRFAVVGDTLFKGGIGRTDLIGGDIEILLNSIRNRLLTLDDDFIIFPGHGPSTTPKDERISNPFINGC